MEYGRITDRPAPPASASAASVEVTLYTALGCPFCPVIERRLESLRSALGFTLRRIDVTLRPDLLASKGIRSVPSVEIGGRILTGLVSSEDLAAAIVPCGVHVAS
jgi:glutaredoxin